ARRGRSATTASSVARAHRGDTPRRRGRRGQRGSEAYGRVHHDRDEEQRKVQERVQVHATREGTLLRRSAAQEPDGVTHEDDAKHQRREEVDEADVAREEE